VLLATKLPGWVVKDRADMDAVLKGQLGRLRTDRIDCYLLHGVNATASPLSASRELSSSWMPPKPTAASVTPASPSTTTRLPSPPSMDAYDWDFCQIQYNFMDTDYQAGKAGLAYAGERDLGVVIMEPSKGDASEGGLRLPSRLSGTKPIPGVPPPSGLCASSGTIHG